MARQSRKTLYLDICTLCRPFDNQNQMRIRLETNAYYLILQAIQEKKYVLAISPVHFAEAGAIGDTEERGQVLSILERFGTTIECDLAVTKERAEYLYSRHFGIADAAHAAFAEAAADVFVTCDDRLVRQCIREKVGVNTVNPVEFAMTENLK